MGLERHGKPSRKLSQQVPRLDTTSEDILVQKSVQSSQLKFIITLDQLR